MDIKRAPKSKIKKKIRNGVMIAVGVILLIVGFLTGVSILWTIGIIRLVIGAVLWIMGSAGHAVAGRRHYW